MQDITKIAIKYKETKEEIYFNQLYNHFYDKIYHFISPILNYNDDLIKDILSKTFLKLYQRIDEYKPQFEISTWLLNIAKRDAYRYHKVKKREKTSTLSELNLTITNGESETPPEVILGLVSKNPNDSEIDQCLDFTDASYENEINKLQKQCYYRKVLKTFDTLPEKQRVFLEDFVFNELNYKDIAEKHNVSLDLVRMRIHSARNNLKNKLTVD